MVCSGAIYKTKYWKHSHLVRMMGEHKMRIADVGRETGFSRASITLLYKETAQKVDLEAIEKLCLLFECQVGNLLELTKQ